MKKLRMLSVVILVIAFGAAGCKKKEAPPMPPPMPPQGAPGQPGGPAPHGPMGGQVEKKVVVPEGVKGQWKAVKIEIENKEKKTKKVYTVNLNSVFKVPDSDLTLKVGEFFPHFTMTADTITSASNNLENPALQVEIQQAGKDVFKGWLFGKFPAVHPFQHDKYGVILLEGVKK